MSISKIVLSAVLATGLMAAGINLASAEAAPAPAPMHDHEMATMDHDAANMAERLQKKLSLSDEQKAKVQKVIEDMRKDSEKLREELKKLHDETTAKFKEVLNDEQFKKWEDMRHQREEEHRKMMNKS